MRAEQGRAFSTTIPEPPWDAPGCPLRVLVSSVLRTSPVFQDARSQTRSRINSPRCRGCPAGAAGAQGQRTCDQSNFLGKGAKEAQLSLPWDKMPCVEQGVEVSRVVLVPYVPVLEGGCAFGHLDLGCKKSSCKIHRNGENPIILTNLYVSPI